MHPKYVDIITLSGLTSQYDADVRMLGSSSDWSAREWIERFIINQYDHLQSEQPAAWRNALLTGRGNGRKSDCPPAPLSSMLPHGSHGSRMQRIC